MLAVCFFIQSTSKDITTSTRDRRSAAVPRSRIRFPATDALTLLSRAMKVSSSSMMLCALTKRSGTTLTP
jgi:hypothetical protein